MSNQGDDRNGSHLHPARHDGYLSGAGDSRRLIFAGSESVSYLVGSGFSGATRVRRGVAGARRDIVPFWL